MSNLAVDYSRAQNGIQAPLVRVEVHFSRGLPRLSIVGLPKTVVKESKDRVRAAIINGHLEFPKQRITINLSLADLHKEDVLIYPTVLVFWPPLNHTNAKAVLVAGLKKMDLVTREEFDVQKAILAKTRQKLKMLETELKSLQK